ncbi:MAG: AIR synthase-related protein, partial [Pseudohongiellaceae bacterium]
GARPGDLVYVTGVLGNAGIGLRMIENQEFGRELTSEAAAQLNRCYYAPIPRVEFGKRIKAVTSCIDISDGLLADLGHIAGQSRVGMSIRQAAIPVSAAAIQLLGKAQAQNFALSCGDDYELAFTVPAAQVAVMEKAAAETGTIVTCIGKVTEGDSLICLDAEDKPVTVGVSGYQHF